MKVLVVDDVRFFRYSLERLLTNAGHSVSLAGSGPQALEILRTDHEIDAVITDLVMPQMSGLEFHAAARELFQCEYNGDPRPSFILISTFDPKSLLNGGVVQQALAAGFADVLCKPLDQGEVLECLEEMSGTKEPVQCAGSGT
jgi:CheY-like chemotaxis protein